MISKDKVTEIFCIIGELDWNLDVELNKKLHLPCCDGSGKLHSNHKGRLSESEIMIILVCCHFDTYRVFKEYCLHCILGWLGRDFPDAVSYSHFVDPVPHMFVKMILF